jgi:hypothetical protein
VLKEEQMAAILHEKTIPKDTARSKISSWKAAKWLIALAIFAVAAFFGYRYWNESRLYATTENAPALADYLRPLHLSPTDTKAIAIIAGQIARQAESAAMLDVFKLITWSFLGMLPLVLVLRKSRPATDPMASVPPQWIFSGHAAPPSLRKYGCEFRRGPLQRK